MALTLKLPFATNKALTAATGPTPTIVRNSDATYFDASGVLQTAGTNTARFDHNPVTGASLGLLCEPERTNVLNYSQDFSNAAWTKTGVTITSNATTSPDGTTNADEVVEDSAGGTHRVRQAFTPDGSSVYCLSMMAKASSVKDNIYISVTTGGFPAAAISKWDVTDGTLQSEGAGVDESITKDLGDGWYRFTMIVTSNGTNATNVDYGFCSTGALGISYTGNGTDSAYITKIQVEAGTKPSSYILSTGGVDTRNADLITSTDMSFLDTAATAQGTFYIKASFPYAGTASRRILTLDDGGTTDRIYFELDAADNANFATVHSADTDGASDGAAVITAGATFQAAARYADDDVHAYVNGTSSGQDTTAALPLADNPTTLRLGADSAGVVDAIHVQQVRYYNTALTDDEVEGMSNGTFPSGGNPKALVRNAAQNLSRNLVINIGS